MFGKKFFLKAVFSGCAAISLLGNTCVFAVDQVLSEHEFLNNDMANSYISIVKEICDDSQNGSQFVVGYLPLSIEKVEVPLRKKIESNGIRRLAMLFRFGRRRHRRSRRRISVPRKSSIKDADSSDLETDSVDFFYISDCSNKSQSTTEDDVLLLHRLLLKFLIFYLMFC